MPALLDETRTDAKVQAYIDGVLSGDMLVCKYVRQAVERHVRDLETGAERGLWFDDIDADNAIQFIECLKHSKGEWAGRPLVLEPWQAFIIWTVFGWKKDDGTRRFNTAFVSVARKCGKSTMAAAVGHKLFVADGEPGAEVYSVATKREQAKIVHEEAKRMVRKCPYLQKLVTILRDNLFIANTESKYEPLGADADTTDGLNVSGAIIDEVHAHKTRDLWDVIETATGARRNPLMLAITTAGDSSDNTSIYAELKDRTVKVLEGTIGDDSWFGIIYTLDDADAWEDESVWVKANPNLGISVKLDDLRRKCQKARETPDAVSNFRRKHCNQETETSNPWLTTDEGSAWSACAGGKFYGRSGLQPEVIERHRGASCWVGGDLSSVSDLTTLVFAFPGDNREMTVLPFCWCPRDNAVGRERDKRVPYLTWADQGYLMLTEGNSVDYDCLRECLRNARDKWGWKVERIAFDPNNARYLMSKLTEEDGFSSEQIVEHLQTTQFMNDPIGATEKLILDGKLRHGNHPVLRWCVSNAIIYNDTGGRRRFNKKAIREKIDMAVAMVMAVGQAVASVPMQSVYERRGLLEV